MKFWRFLVCWLAGSMIACAGDVEVGDVNWSRDLDQARENSSTSGKPVLVLFQEVPGCSGCQKYGKEVLSHPQIVEAIETEFHPVLVYNNRPGKDSDLLKEFGEPAWNYQVIRYQDSKGKDVIPRKDQVWTVQGTAARMVEALRSAGRESPKYLVALAGRDLADEPAVAGFSMYCFWTGEFRLGGLEGVLRTEAGWVEGSEVTLVEFDRKVISFEELMAKAASYDCARKVYASNEEDFERAEKGRLPAGLLDQSYRAAGQSDQKRQISGTAFEKVELSPVQATKVNALARTNPSAALEWLSPRQRERLKES